MAKWIKWSQWDQNGRIAHGELPLPYLEEHLKVFCREAKKLMERVNADHVLYGMKKYDGNGDLKEVRFYMQPMDEATFHERTATLTDAVVYALHKLS